jgi:hypothetical protein
MPRQAPAPLVKEPGRTKGLPPPTQTSPAALVDGYRAALIAGAGLAALGSVTASALALAGRRQPEPRTVAPQPAEASR